jgi:hypothetical protein
MRRPLFFVTSAALLMASSPAFAGPCPATRAEGQAFLAGLTNLGKDPCFYPCIKAFKYDAAGQKTFGVQPLSILDRSQQRVGLTSVVFVLPGALGKYSASFRKAFPGTTCPSSGDLCYRTMQKAIENGLRQVELRQTEGDPNSYLHCSFEPMD